VSMGRILVVANQTLGGPELDRTVRDRIEAGSHSFYVLVPMIRPELEASWMPGEAAFGMPAAPRMDTDAIEEAESRSRQRLHLMIERIRDLGGEPDGEVGDSDPFGAVRKVLEHEKFGEIIVSTLPIGISRWLKMDLPSRIERHVDVPVTTIVAGGD
jgi:hypothetical protein